MSRTKLIMLSLLAILALFTLAPMAFGQNVTARRTRVSAAEAEPERREPAQIRMVTLEHAIAENVSRVLRDLFRHGLTGQINIVADSRTNSLLLSANEQDLKQMQDVISTLDGKLTVQMAPVFYKPETSVIVLKNRKADSVGRVLSNLYEIRSRSPGPGRRSAPSETETVRVVVDDELNAVILQAATKTMKDIKSLITQLDVPVK